MKKNQKIKWLVGIDEVGRGPLAGPVAVGAFCIGFFDTKAKSYSKFMNDLKKSSKKVKLPPVRDSKKLTESAREEWVSFLKDFNGNSTIESGTNSGEIFKYKIHFGSAKQIDKKGIVVVIKDLVSKCLESLDVLEHETSVLLDGSLKAPEKYFNQQTIIKGDEKEIVISFASILAKVERDNHMKKISKKYKEYGLDIHKGYGTKSHIKAIKKYGKSDIHRVSFLKNIL